MHNLEFRPFDENHFLLYQNWFTDSDLSQRMERPTRRWLNYIRSDPRVHSWMVYDGPQPVGQVQVDRELSGNGSVAVIVNPSLRNRGYGTSIMRALFSRPELASLDEFEGYIEPDHQAARKLCEATGFHLTNPEPDEEGFLNYVYRRTSDEKVAWRPSYLAGSLVFNTFLIVEKA